jgi:cell division protein ZapE
MAFVPPAFVPVTSTSPTVSLWLAKRIASGSLTSDPAQLDLAKRLDALSEQVRASLRAPKSSALGWFLSRNATRPTDVRGLYIHGGVGRGKTMLMDIFFKRCPEPRKRRVHFHDFMMDVQDRLTKERDRISREHPKDPDPVAPVAAEIAAESRILCFDEFTVTDIADAMILSRLFTALFAKGVVLVATSNVAPDDLYKNGLNRDLFLPFLDVLCANVDVIAFGAGQDYRAETLQSAERWLMPLTVQTLSAIDATFLTLTRGTRGEKTSLAILGRSLAVPATALGVAKFSFDELCREPLGARDYLAISRAFHTIIITSVPVISAEDRNVAKRFIMLVDALYDRHILLIVQAAAEPEQLYAAPQGTEAFEFARTISRLAEMRGQNWPPRQRFDVEQDSGQIDKVAS